MDHRFHSIEEDLAVPVFFAPAEGSAPTGRAHPEDTEGASK
jgi:hypothetical protein